MKIEDIRIGHWYGTSDGKIGQARTINVNSISSGEVYLQDSRRDMVGWFNAADLTEVPATALGLEQRVKDIDARLRFIEDALGDEAVFTASGATKEIEAINRRLDALEAKPAPDQPLEVGDKVWVKGTLTEIDDSGMPYRIDFGHDDLFWLYKDVTIKRADQPTRAERIAKLDDLIDVIKRA